MPYTFNPFSGTLDFYVSGGGLTVGTTSISGGTSTRILYNNGGTLGEYTLTGTGTTVVMQTSPTLTTSLLTTAGQGFYFGTANITELRNSTNAQTFRVYNTYTDASNNEGFQAIWFSNTLYLQNFKNGTGTLRSIQITNNGVNGAFSVDNLGRCSIGGQSSSSAIAALTIGNATFTSTSGSNYGVLQQAAFSPSSTSTAVAYGYYLQQTINYSAGTPGAGSYEAFRIQAIETALPTGTNYLIRASAGAAGTTEKFAVRNNGAIYSADTTLHHSTAALTNGAAAAAGTLLNAPAAGDPTKWIPIDDNGTTRYIPAW